MYASDVGDFRVFRQQFRLALTPSLAEEFIYTSGLTALAFHRLLSVYDEILDSDWFAHRRQMKSTDLSATYVVLDRCPIKRHFDLCMYPMTGLPN